MAASRRPKMNNLRVAIWGLGPHALNKILPAIDAVPGIELYGICSRNSEVVSACSKDWGCIGWTSPDEMLVDHNVDAVYVATPIGLHFLHGEKVLLAGKHLWCEKPLGMCLKDVNALLAIARARGLQVAEGFMFKYHPHFIDLLEGISEDKIGPINSILIRFGIPTMQKPGFRLSPELGGGAFLDVGCYTIAAVLEIFSGLEYSIKYAEISAQTGSPVDTFGRVILQFSNGAQAVLEWGINCSYRNEIDVWGALGGVYTEKIFSKPSDYEPYFIMSDSTGVKSRVNSVPENHFILMFMHFRDLIIDALGSKNEFYRISERARLMQLIKSSTN